MLDQSVVKNDISKINPMSSEEEEDEQVDEASYSYLSNSLFEDNLTNKEFRELTNMKCTQNLQEKLLKILEENDLCYYTLKKKVKPVLPGLYAGIGTDHY